MIKKLTLLGLFVLPLFVLHGYDFRYPRELLALGIALVVAMYGLTKGGLYFFSLKDKGFLFFIAWCLFSTIFLPNINGMSLAGGENVCGLWNFKALMYLIVYLFAFAVLSSEQSSKDQLNKIALAMFIPAVITAIIVIGQNFGIENFFRNPTGANETQEHLMAVTQYKLGGLMGHPTLVSAYLVMVLPVAFYLRRNFYGFIIASAILLTKSDVALAAMLLAFVFFWSFGSLKRSISAITGGVILAGLLILMQYHVQDSGRFGLWSSIWHDMTTPFMNPHGLTYFWTGLGIGSFSYLYQLIHQDSMPWSQAHNEYLQILWGAGAIGLGIFLYTVFHVYKDIWVAIKEDRDLRYFATMLFAVCVCAGGTFVWQLGVFQFYTIVILAIVYQLKRKLIC